MDNIFKIIEEKFDKNPFKHRGIKITKEIIQATIDILNEQPNKQMIQMSANLKA